ncbi:SOS response-associated peptidase [Crenobacter cavernae]|uniref:SOS response-associated peptidase n=1 Tax=Crenobacter cavernae TaxID=2290923 RepID=UPI003D337039
MRPTVDGAYEVVDAHWGLIPPWAKERKIGYSTINARAETLAEKPAARSRRCTIPASGPHEWQDLGGGRKQPWHIASADGGRLAFAGRRVGVQHPQ